VGRFMTGIGVRVLVVAVLVVGGFVLRDRLSSDAGQLQVGDCFDDPGGVEISAVQHHPCIEAHTGEVIYTGNMTGDDGSYPSDDAIFEWVSAYCLPAFASYTGQAYDGQVLDIGYYHPTTDGWTKGDRQVICYATRLDSSTMTGSLKVASQ
jgi:Septum formation